MSVGSYVRIAISVVVLCGSAQAAPKYRHTPSTSRDPVMVEAERRWTAAEVETDPKRARELWVDAADAFLAIVEAGKLDKAEQVEAARAGLAAFKNALHVDVRARLDVKDTDFARTPQPKPIPAEQQRLIRLANIYIAFDGNSDEGVSLKFLRANVYRRFEHFDMAIPALSEIVNRHRSHEVAEYAASLLLDSWNRLERYDELLALTDKLRADRAWLANKPELAETLRRIKSQSLRSGPHFKGQAGVEPDRDDHERWAATFLELAEEDLRSRDGEELLYNALVSFYQARSLARVRELAVRFEQRFPHSPLRSRVMMYRFAIAADTANYADAAKIAAHLIARFPDDKSVPTAGLDAIGWLVALGDLDGAVRLVRKLEPIVRGTSVTDLGARKLQLVAALLERRRRADAVKLVASITTVRWEDRDLSIMAARVFAEAACPIPLVDGLCLQRRDRSLTARVLSDLGRVRGEDDEVARQMELDFALEDVLRGKRGNRPDDVAARYRELVTSKRADVRAAAHARLARLARHQQRLEQARAEVEACLAEQADGWLAICAREHALLEQPRPRVPERLPAPMVPIHAEALEKL